MKSIAEFTKFGILMQQSAPKQMALPLLYCNGADRPCEIS